MFSLKMEFVIPNFSIIARLRKIKRELAIPKFKQKFKPEFPRFSRLSKPLTQRFDPKKCENVYLSKN